ncbi:E3 ubiquitin-protein ligase Praja-2-like, partial [Arapaima gigas]
VMGQESGKHSWPKPAGGYQTITGRRYGRRHAYISFRPTLAKQRHAATEDPSENKELLSRKQSLSLKGSDALNCKIFMCDQVMDCDPQTLLVSKESADTPKWDPMEKDDSAHCSSLLSFVNIDSYEPESSEGEGEEDETSSDQLLALRTNVDDIILGKEFDYIRDVDSYLYTKSQQEAACSPEGASSETDVKVLSPEMRGLQRKVSGNEQSTGLSRVPTDRLGEGDKSEAVATCPSRRKSLDRKDPRTSQGEMVVRPKVRKHTSENCVEKRKRSQPPETCSGHLKQVANRKCSSAMSFFLTEAERPEKELVFDFPQSDCTPGEVKPPEEKGEDAENCGKIKDEDELWEDLEDFDEKCAAFVQADSRSECSDGECSTTWTSGMEEDSSNESWETLPGFDQSELEMRSSGSSLDEVPELNFISEDQMSLEEGEIPWLSYHEETDSSSSDEDPERTSHFVHPGLFMLDGNNNFEDDSSVSEDFDAEWRFLDDFGEGFGMPPAVSYVDPQLLTYMALEERLVQAMEAALAHLESLAIDVEQAHPPASEDVISRLPHITVLEDHCGKEQCCAICCSEYIKEEVATELPCRHLFHKICVTLWLRKSGTCPVCRHVLSPALPDTSAPTSFISDHDGPPSNRSTAGTR